jgi:hypothetical protein
MVRMRLPMAVLLLVTAVTGCNAPPPVTPLELRDAAAAPARWDLDSAAALPQAAWLRATTANFWRDADADPLPVRFGVQCNVVTGNLTIALMTELALELTNDADTPDEDEDQSIVDQLVEGVVNSIIYKDYVLATAWWDGDGPRRLEWRPPLRRGQDLVMVTKADPQDVLADVLKHHFLLLQLDVTAYGMRHVAFDLRDRASMDSTIGVVRQACRSHAQR